MLLNSASDGGLITNVCRGERQPSSVSHDRFNVQFSRKNYIHRPVFCINLPHYTFLKKVYFSLMEPILIT